MIIRHPYRARTDLGDPSSLPARSDNASGPLVERSRRSRVKRQDNLLPSPIVDPVPLSLSVALPSLIPSFPPVVTNPTPTPVVTGLTPSSSSEGLDPASSSPCLPIEASSNDTLLPKSTPSSGGPPPGLIFSIQMLPTSTPHTEGSIETVLSSLFTHLSSPTPTTFISDESSILPSITTPTNPGLGTAIVGRLDSGPELGPTVINPGEITPDTSSDVTGAVARGRMIAAALSLVLMAGLVLFGIIFCLRRRMRRKSLRLVVGTSRATSNVSSYPAQPQMVEQQENGTTTRDRDAFPGDHSGAAIRDPTLTMVGFQRPCSRPDRYSQISASSTISRSIRFAITGSYHSPTNSYSSRATMPVPPRDVAHTFTPNPFADVSPPHSPATVKTPTDHSAPWRGSNLSNIIKAARGVKT